MKSITGTDIDCQRYASPAECVLVALVLFTLPLFEAPKNLFSVLFLVVWLIQSKRSCSFGSGCNFNWPIIGLGTILWVAPIFSLYRDTITALDSAPRWTLLAIFAVAAARLSYSKAQLFTIWAALLVGGAAAVVESFYVWSFNGKEYPEFRSVGHVNHSSMYTLIVLAAGLGALQVRVKWLSFLGLIGIALSFAFLPPSKSLVGGITIIVLLTIWLGLKALKKWSLRGLLISFVGATFVVSSVLLTPPAEGFRSEILARVSGDNIFAGRDRILNSALAVWDLHPVLGTGWFSFGLATSEQAVRTALEADDVAYDPNVYWHLPHGHNLWTTILIERGVIGVILVTALLFIYFKTFLPIVLSREQVDPVDRGAAVGAFLIIISFAIAGLGNTTMINEHGQAGMSFIAVVYGYLRGRGLVCSNKNRSG